MYASVAFYPGPDHCQVKTLMDARRVSAFAQNRGKGAMMMMRPPPDMSTRWASRCPLLIRTVPPRTRQCQACWRCTRPFARCCRKTCVRYVQDCIQSASWTLLRASACRRTSTGSSTSETKHVLRQQRRNAVFSCQWPLSSRPAHEHDHHHIERPWTNAP